jgi:hypothetical protein
LGGPAPDGCAQSEGARHADYPMVTRDLDELSRLKLKRPESSTQFKK